jgi:hypothetical protein
MHILAQEDPVLHDKIEEELESFMNSDAYNLVVRLERSEQHHATLIERQAYIKSIAYHLKHLFLYFKIACPKMTNDDVSYFVTKYILDCSGLTTQILFAASKEALKMRLSRLRKRIANSLSELLR